MNRYIPHTALKPTAAAKCPIPSARCPAHGRLDEDALRDILSHIDKWKQRKAAKEGLLTDLAPLFALLSSGNAIEGLNAYVK